MSALAVALMGKAGMLDRTCRLLIKTRHEFVSDGTTYYRAARKMAMPSV